MTLIIGFCHSVLKLNFSHPALRSQFSSPRFTFPHPTIGCINGGIVSFSVIFSRFKAWVADLTVGGTWGRTLTNPQQRNLHWFWFNGFFASASDNIILNFVSLYIIALGATGAQVGMMSSITSIVSACILLPGALLAERSLRKKPISLACGINGRFAILMLVFVPILFKGSAAIWIAIAFAVLRDASNYAGYPAWMDLTNSVVPIEGRGRFFGSRNFIMGITGMLTTLLAGKLITLFTSVKGYQIALAAAFVIGMASSYSFSRIDEDAVTITPSKIRRSFNLRELAAMFKGQPHFVALTATAAIWNFAIYIAGPFFNVQMVNVLNFSAATIGLLNVISTFASLLTSKRIGALADRMSNRKLQLISMIFIPVLPMAWLFVTAAWQVAVINTFSGVLWGVFNLVSFNLLLASVPTDQVPRYTAIYQVVVLIAIALGSAVGSGLFEFWGFTIVLIASTVIRVLAAVIFARFVHEPGQSQSSVIS